MTNGQEIPGPEEAVLSTEQQLELSGDQLALQGIARLIDRARQDVDSATHSASFARTYVPRHPGPAPHPEDGGMDWQDYRVAMAEYNDYNQDEDVDYADSRLADTEDRLYALHRDRSLIKDGDEDITQKYAQLERTRIEEQLKKERLAAESAARWATYERGAEIKGSAAVADDVIALTADPVLGEVQGRISASGWKFVGVPRHSDTALMFKRMPAEAGYAHPHDQWRFPEVELLTLNVQEDRVKVEFSSASDLDEEAIKKYGKDLATVDYVGFTIEEDGRVARQEHKHGKVNKWLPNHMDDGTIRVTGLPYIHDVSPDAILSTGNLHDIRGKIAEVTEAMHELASQPSNS